MLVDCDPEACPSVATATNESLLTSCILYIIFHQQQLHQPSPLQSRSHATKNCNTKHKKIASATYLHVKLAIGSAGSDRTKPMIEAVEVTGPMTGVTLRLDVIPPIREVDRLRKGASLDTTLRLDFYRYPDCRRCSDLGRMKYD